MKYLLLALIASSISFSSFADLIVTSTCESKVMDRNVLEDNRFQFSGEGSQRMKIKMGEFEIEVSDGILTASVISRKTKSGASFKLINDDQIHSFNIHRKFTPNNRVDCLVEYWRE